MESSDISYSKFNISRWLTEAWDILIKDFWHYIGLTCIYLIIIGTVSTTGLGIFLVTGPLNIGFFYIITLRMFGKPFDISDISKGFNYYINAILINILVTFFVSVGFTLCIIPGIFIYSWYLLPYIYIFDRDMDFWKAMEESRKVAFNRFFEFFVLFIVLGFIFFLGILLCGVGILIVIPYIKIVIMLVYRDLIGFNKSY